MKSSTEEFIVALNAARQLYTDGQVHPIKRMSKTCLRNPEEAAIFIGLEQKYSIGEVKRTCLHCNLVLPIDARKSARYCNRACKQAVIRLRAA